MERFTEKGTGIINCGGTIASLGKEEYNRRYSEQVVKGHIKLGQLEDIEEELGIDLITLFKAITEGFYIKSNDSMKAHYRFAGWLFKTNSDYVRANEYFIEVYRKDYIFVKDYGKTWALTKEELL